MTALTETYFDVTGYRAGACEAEQRPARKTRVRKRKQAKHAKHAEQKELLDGARAAQTLCPNGALPQDLGCKSLQGHLRGTAVVSEAAVDVATHRSARDWSVSVRSAPMLLLEFQDQG